MKLDDRGTQPTDDATGGTTAGGVDSTPVSTHGARAGAEVTPGAEDALQTRPSASSPPTTQPDCTPDDTLDVVGLLTADEALVAAVRAVAADLEIAVATGRPAAVTIIDPSLGAATLRAHLDDAPPGARAAVLADSGHPTGVFVAVRNTRATLIVDPRVASTDLLRFLREAFPSAARASDRRQYPRAPGMGIRVVAPEGAEVLDISPYGARVKLPGRHEIFGKLHLQLLLSRLERPAHIDYHVVRSVVQDGWTVARLQVVKIEQDAQRELIRIAKASALCDAISSTFRLCEEGTTRGFRQLLRHGEVVGVLEHLEHENAAVSFASMSRGRALAAKVVAVDRAQRQMTLQVGDSDVPLAVGDWVLYSTAADHESYTMDGHVLALDGPNMVLSFPGRCILTDKRAQSRLPLSHGSGLSVRLGERRFAVTDISARGFSFFVPDAAEAPPQETLADVVFEGAGHETPEVVMLHKLRPQQGGVTVGAAFTSRTSVHFRGDRVPFVEEQFSGHGLKILDAPRPYRGEPLFFMSHGRRIAGLWNEVEHPGPRTAVVIPPAWAKTKESVSLLAQFICACFDANERHVAVLRIDYANTIGESHKDPESRVAGQEAMRIRVSDCVEDIRGAVGVAGERLGTVDMMALIGMSFSGPLALRAAAEDQRVTHLIELMGASDIRDLIRTATGGIDYVGKFLLGIGSGPQNVLGLLTEPDVWSRDGMAHRLLELQDAQDDATRLSVPLLWIHGQRDGYVNPTRVRSILAQAESDERAFVTVPCAHVPSKSSEALAAYYPLCRFLLRHHGIDHPIVWVPTATDAEEVRSKELSRAPRTPIPSPRDYWRRYMLGERDDSLAFDVLAMTTQYQGMMRQQLDLLNVRAGDAVHDVGGGPGHALRQLAERPDFETLTATIYDIVPQLLERAAARFPGERGQVRTVEWDADNDAIPSELRGARKILMSLFLSCLSDAPGLLRRLRADLAPGTRLVASSMKPDVELSYVYRDLLESIESGTVQPPNGLTAERFAAEIRDYMNSAAWLLRLADEGTFRFYSADELAQLFSDAGFEVREVHQTFGPPYEAVAVLAVVPAGVA